MKRGREAGQWRGEFGQRSLSRTHGRERMSALAVRESAREGTKFFAYNSSMEIEKLLKAQKEQILAIARKNGVYDVCVFGSVARGEASDSALQDQNVTLIQIAIRGVQPAPNKFSLSNFGIQQDEKGKPNMITCL